MPTDMLTVREAAARLKLDPQTLRRWIRSGVLPARRLGKKEYRIDAADLEARLSSRSEEQAGRRTEAVRALLMLREQLRAQGPSVAELVAESRAELEGRGETSGR